MFEVLYLNLVVINVCVSHSFCHIRNNKDDPVLTFPEVEL